MSFIIPDYLDVIKCLLIIQFLKCRTPASAGAGFIGDPLDAVVRRFLYCFL